MPTYYQFTRLRLSQILPRWNRLPKLTELVAIKICPPSINTNVIGRNAPNSQVDTKWTHLLPEALHSGQDRHDQHLDDQDRCPEDIGPVDGFVDVVEELHFEMIIGFSFKFPGRKLLYDR